jgi:hypothetical protein
MSFWMDKVQSSHGQFGKSLSAPDRAAQRFRVRHAHPAMPPASRGMAGQELRSCYARNPTDRAAEAGGPGGRQYRMSLEG